VERKFGLGAPQKKYKVWLALSYAHYRLANRIYSKIYMPLEDLKPQEAQSPVRKKALEHLQLTLDYARAAHDFLDKTILAGEHIEALPRHNRYLRASINNIIFCQTILLPDHALKEALYESVSDQEMFSEDIQLWHENRYSDTIARYYYRLARITEDSSFVKKALIYNRRSISSNGLSEKSVPNQLAKSIERYFPTLSEFHE
jgi:hypothetical protein